MSLTWAGTPANVGEVEVDESLPLVSLRHRLRASTRKDERTIDGRRRLHERLGDEKGDVLDVWSSALAQSLRAGHSSPQTRAVPQVSSWTG